MQGFLFFLFVYLVNITKYYFYPRGGIFWIMGGGLFPLVQTELFQRQSGVVGSSNLVIYGYIEISENYNTRLEEGWYGDNLVLRVN